MVMKKRQTKRTAGARNLLLLGIFSTLVALATTGVSLAIYHNSGDIYLDRSRPGYLPDEEEVEKDEGGDEDEYDFGTVEELNARAVEQYLENLNKRAQKVDDYLDAFSADALSNDKLIQKVEPEEQKKEQ